MINSGEKNLSKLNTKFILFPKSVQSSYYVNIKIHKAALSGLKHL